MATYKYLNIEDAIKYYHENCVVPLQNKVEGVGRRVLALNVGLNRRPVYDGYYRAYSKPSEWSASVKLDDYTSQTFKQFSSSNTPQDSPSGGPGILDSIFSSYITGLQIWRPIPTSSSSNNSWQIWQRARLPSGKWEEWNCVNGIEKNEFLEILEELN